MILSLVSSRSTCSHTEFPSLGPLIQRFPNLVVGDVQQLDDEWRQMAFAEIPFSYDEMAVDEFWGKVGAIANGTETLQFPMLSAFMKSLLFLPHSNADTERIFSQITLIKTKVRNKLSTQTVNALLITKDAILDCTKFTPTNEMVKAMDSSTIYQNSNIEDEA